MKSNLQIKLFELFNPSALFKLKRSGFRSGQIVGALIRAVIRFCINLTFRIERRRIRARLAAYFLVEVEQRRRGVAPDWRRRNGARARHGAAQNFSDEA